MDIPILEGPQLLVYMLVGTTRPLHGSGTCGMYHVQCPYQQVYLHTYYFPSNVTHDATARTNPPTPPFLTPAPLFIRGLARPLLATIAPLSGDLCYILGGLLRYYYLRLVRGSTYGPGIWVHELDGIVAPVDRNPPRSDDWQRKQFLSTPMLLWFSGCVTVYAGMRL